MGGHIKKWLKIPDYKKCPYLRPNFTKYIDKNKIKIIFEVGSRDLRDAHLLQQYYKARVFAFECNPDSLKICRRNLAKFNDIVLIENAIWNEVKTISFYPVISSESKTFNVTNGKNIGASSCFLSNNTHHETLVQSEIQVQATRLDIFCDEYEIQQIDLLCMDVQGATYEALNGLGEKIKNVHYIISEIEKTQIYEGQHCLNEITSFLAAKNFELTASTPYYLPDGTEEIFADYLFVNKKFKK